MYNLHRSKLSMYDTYRFIISISAEENPWEILYRHSSFHADLREKTSKRMNELSLEFGYNK